jgi:environmental stress-induced protein Ves
VSVKVSQLLRNEPPQSIDLREIAPKPWKNGAGLTREIAVEPPEASSDDFAWRISVAEIARDAPFSVFSGVDRCIVLLRGRGMRLRSDDGAMDARLDEPLQPFRFAGDTPLSATLIDGPCADFNVMVRRAGWRAEVSAASEARPIEPAGAALVFCARGEASVDADAQPGTDLREGQVALWRSGAPRRALQVGTSDTQVLIVQLHAF